MYVPVWLLVLVAMPMALYAGYLLILLVTLGGMHVLLGMSKLGEALSAALSAGLAVILCPFRHVGPWFDYAAAAGILAALCTVFALLA